MKKAKQRGKAARHVLPKAVAACIPDKLYFRIGEVARLLGVKPHVLRYWETEFTAVSPTKAASGHRVYRRVDVERLVDIKRLVHEERYSIAGAKRRLKARLADATMGEGAPAPAETGALVDVDNDAEGVRPGLRSDAESLKRALKQAVQELDELARTPISRLFRL
jgi:DNA-binding transcriptional MerR regulator